MIKQYLNTHPVAKLQIGRGGNMLPVWLNTDGQMDSWFQPKLVKLETITFDARKPL